MEQGQKWISVALVMGLALLAACGSDDDDDNDKGRRPPPVAGNFVGKVQGTKSLVAVMTTPGQGGRGGRRVNVFVSDGRRLGEWLPGSVSGNAFVAKSEDGDTRAEGKLGRNEATGSVTLPGRRKAARFKAGRATGGAGLYELTVARGGKLRGTSAAGLLLKGDSSLPDEGSGSFKLVDGRRLKFRVSVRAGGDPIRVKAGNARLIVLPDGQLRGAGKSRSGGKGSDFFIRSS